VSPDSRSSGWQPDILGDGYAQQVLGLGPDPDGEGPVAAVLVRREPLAGQAARGVVVYLHGFARERAYAVLGAWLTERELASQTK
jgi:hypothetical protein